MANIDATIKAHDKRLTGMEKALDEFQKEFRKSGDFAALEKQISANAATLKSVVDNLKSLAGRVKTLETVVKALATSTKSGGANSQDVERTIKEMKDKIEKLTREKESQKFDPKAIAAYEKKVQEIDKKKSLLETAVKTLGERQKKRESEEVAQRTALQREREKKWKEQEEENKRIVKEHNDMAKKVAEQAQLDARLRTLEAMVNAALAKK